MREDWVEVELGDVCEIVSGKNQSKVVNPDGQYPIYGSGGIIGRADDYLCNEGTTIIGRKGTINSPIYVRTKFWNVDTAFGFSPSEVLENHLLYFFCEFFNFKKLDKSTAVPSLAKRDLLSIEFPLPPLPEQRAIVGKIEQLFSELDNGIANLKTAQQQLKVYRQAVLKKAFEGELSETKKIGTWSTKKSDDVFDYVTSGSRGWAKYYSDTGALFIRITNLNFNTLKLDLISDKIQRVNLSDVREGTRTRVMTGDILISITGYLGMTAVAPENIEEAYVNQHIALVRPKTEYDSTYLGYFLSSETGGLKQFNLAGRGATKAGLTLGDIKNVQIPVPDTLEEQHHIVQEIESRLSVCDKLEESITQSLQKAEALRQSILKKAFEGRLLTETELAACRKEKDWEPAGVLLKRVKRRN